MTQKEKNNVMDEIINGKFTRNQLGAFEDKMNHLLGDTGIKAERTACYRVVSDKLINRMEERFDAEISKLLEATPPEKELIKDANPEIIRIITQEFGLSQAVAKEYLANCVSPTENAQANAIEAVKASLLKKETVAFKQELINSKIISEASWSRFANSIRFPDDETLAAIAESLGENKKERERIKKELLEKSISELFVMNKAVSGDVNQRTKHLTEQNSIENFCAKTGISRDALEKFNLDILRKKEIKKIKELEEAGETDKAKELAEIFYKNPPKIKYYELLKLIAAFVMEEPEAREFLGKANRSFVTTIDLAFLTAITKGYELGFRKPIHVALITQHLSGWVDENFDYSDCPRFVTPYTFSYINEASGRNAQYPRQN